MRVLAFLGAVTTAAAVAHGSTLELRYVPQPALERTTGVLAVSPDGRSVYMLAGLDDRTRLVVLARDPRTGKLARPPGRAACVRVWYAASKSCSSAPGLNNSVALAATGQDVAVAAYASGQIALLRRAGARWRVASCLGDRIVGTFRCGAARGLAGVEDLAFSHGGHNLYAAARVESPGLLVLARDPATGALRQLPGASGCFERQGMAGSRGCSALPVDWYSPRLVRVTPDERTVITDSNTRVDGGGIFVFSRASNGSLTFVRCYTDSGVAPCELNPAGRDLSDLELTPDGRTVIAAGESRLFVLGFDPATGALERRQCLARGTASGCVKADLKDYASLVVSPDGRRLFTSSYGGIRSYAIDKVGTVSAIAGRRACVGGHDCTPLPKPACCSETELAITPDGRWLYAAPGTNAFALQLLG